MFVPTVSLRFSNCVVTLFVELEVCGARSVSERRVVSSRSSRSGAMGSPISAAGCPGGPRAWSLVGGAPQEKSLAAAAASWSSAARYSRNALTCPHIIS